MCRRFLVLVTVCAASLGSPSPGPGQETDALATARLLEQAFVDAVERAERSVVAITRVPARSDATAGAALDPFGREIDAGGTLDPADPDFIPESFGSGVVIEHSDRPDERFVLTTYHVALGSLHPSEEERAAEVHLYITLPGRVVVDAEFVGGELKRVEGQIEAAHPYVDLAVLRLDLEGAGLEPDDVPALKPGDADNLKKGRWVMALGNPYAQARDGSASASMGMISNISRRPEPPDGEPSFSNRDATLHSFGTLLHVDTRLDLGMSGGALINLDGELIGITTSLAALQGYEKSVGYAIPLDRGIWRIVEELLNGWEPDLGFMGIAPRTLTRRDMRIESYSGLLTQPSAVQAALVAADSPASQADLRTDDVIQMVDSQLVYDATDLMRVVALLGPDTVTRVQVWRPGTDETLWLDVRLGKWPVADDSRLMTSRERFAAWRGISVDFPTARRRFLPGDILAGRYPQAVVITNVLPESPAADSGLAMGEFIRRVGAVDVRTPAEFHDAVANASGDVQLTMLDGKRRTIAAP